MNFDVNFFIIKILTKKLVSNIKISLFSNKTNNFNNKYSKNG